MGAPVTLVAPNATNSIDQPVGTSGNPLFTQAASGTSPATATDTGSPGLAISDVTNSGTPGTWVQLMAASASRMGASIQNKDTSAVVYLIRADSAPGSGTQAGEIGIPVFPAYFKFDYIPRGAYYMRSTVASSKVALNTW